MVKMSVPPTYLHFFYIHFHSQYVEKSSNNIYKFVENVSVAIVLFSTKYFIVIAIFRHPKTQKHKKFLVGLRVKWLEVWII